MFPFPVDEQVMARGRERFDIYCSPCHGRTGDGDGMVVRRGYRPAAVASDPIGCGSAPVGHFFDVMTNGFGAMPDYAAQISAEDRWAIVAYIRALQLSAHATIDGRAGRTRRLEPLRVIPFKETAGDAIPELAPLQRKLLVAGAAGDGGCRSSGSWSTRRSSSSRI